MEKLLVINADDFGLCEGVNKGVAQAHTQGVLTSATVMVNGAAAEGAIEIAKGLPRLGVGVHLNLTEGKPIPGGSIVKALINSEGVFAYSAGGLALRALVSGKVRRAIEAELAAQIQWVIERGIKPTHLDSHKHIHSFPAIFPIVCRLARRFGIGAIRYCYEPKEVTQIPFPRVEENGKKRANRVRRMAWVNRRQNAAYLKTSVLLGVAHTGAISPQFLIAVAQHNWAGTAEIMTHPGYAYDLDASRTRLVKERERELMALCNPAVKGRFEDAGIKLVHYGQT